MGVNIDRSGHRNRDISLFCYRITLFVNQNNLGTTSTTFLDTWPSFPSMNRSGQSQPLDYLLRAEQSVHVSSPPPDMPNMECMRFPSTLVPLHAQQVRKYHVPRTTHFLHLDSSNFINWTWSPNISQPIAELCKDLTRCFPFSRERERARPIWIANKDKAATMLENALVEATDCSGPE